MKILICDDKEDNANNTKDLIDSRGIVESLHSTELESTLITFLNDVSGILDSNESAGNGSVSSDFDEFDVLIVDNNLTELQLGGARLTAETIIGYLRAFSDVPYIISLNKNPHVDFDLKFLFGDYQSLADLALNTEHLSSRKLWGGKSEGDFAPWYWPSVADASARRRNQVEFVAENFDRPVWEALGFPTEAASYLSQRAKSRIPSRDGELLDVSFEEFFESSRTLPPAEIDTLKDLAEKQSDFARKAICQIAAYEVDRWLRRDVLGAQDVLIDLPHLVAQMPFLLGDKANNLDHWNEVSEYEEPTFGFDEQLFQKHLMPASFGHNMWVPGPCFWWPSLKSDEALTEVFFAAEDDGWPVAVFCEDISRFVSITEAGAPPKEFEAEIDGSWIRRYIANLHGYSYSPRGRVLGSAS